MCAQIIEARVKQKKDTLPNWEANTMILLDGEQAFVVNGSGQPINFKIGDGTKTFSELPFWIQYDQAAFIPVSGLALPTPTQPVGYSILGEGTYTHSSGGFTVPSGHWGVANWDGSAWSFSDMGALPAQQSDKTTVVGKNKANPSKIVNNRLISTTANTGIQVGAGWAIWIVEFGASLDFAVSGWDSARTEIAFYKGAVPSAGAPPIGQLISSGTALSQGLTKVGSTLIAKTPQETTMIVFNVENATEDPSVHANFQVESGTTITSYEPYTTTEVITGIGGKEIVPDSLVVNGSIVSADNLVLKDNKQPTEFTFDNSVAGAYSTMTFVKDGRTILQRFESKNVLSLDASRSFDWNQTHVNGIIKHNMADENAPVRIDSYTMGGNHGFRRYNITLNSHGKTNSDIGSVYSSGSDQWVIVGIPNANTISVSHRLNNTTLLTSNLLTWVSGGTNTSNIDSTTKVSIDAYPPYKNYSLKTFVDGKEVTTNAVFTGKDRLTFIETYDLMLKSSIMEWFVSNVGTITVPTQPDGIGIARITNSYSFDTNAMCYTDQSFLGLYDSELPFQDIMFLMNNKLSVAHQVYVPKSLPFVQNSVNYDFSVPMAYTTPTSARINFDSYKYEKWGRIPDRVAHLATGENLGFVIGFLPIEDGATERRKQLATRKAIQFQESGKIYMSGVDSDSITTFKKGDYYRIQGYKGYFFKQGNRICNYVVKCPECNYYYFDWITSGIDSLELPDKFELVEKSSNVNFISKNKVNVKIDSINKSAFLIVKG